jgi:excisionase family DNA binding protein
MNAASDRYGARIGGGYWLPGWAVRRLHADPRSPINRYRKDLRGRDAELYRVMTNLCLVALQPETRPNDAPKSDIDAHSNQLQLTTAQAAAELNMTQRQVVRLIETGRLGSRRTGRGPHLFAGLVVLGLGRCCLTRPEPGRGVRALAAIPVGRERVARRGVARRGVAGRGVEA